VQSDLRRFRPLRTPDQLINRVATDGLNEVRHDQYDRQGRSQEDMAQQLGEHKKAS
jgi:hypothetical protein